LTIFNLPHLNHLYLAPDTGVLFEFH